MIKKIFYTGLIVLVLLVGLGAFLKLPVVNFSNESLVLECYNKLTPIFGTSKVCNAQLRGEITHISKYTPLVTELLNATKGDVVNIHLVGPGGMVMTSNILETSIKLSKAQVNTIAVGDVYSADAFLLIAGDVVHVPRGLSVLFHRGAYGNLSTAQGDKICRILIPMEGMTDRGVDMKSKCLSIFAAFSRTEETNLKRILKPFLTAKQIQQVIDGHDVVVSTDDILAINPKIVELK